MKLFYFLIFFGSFLFRDLEENFEKCEASRDFSISFWWTSCRCEGRGIETVKFFSGAKYLCGGGEEKSDV